MSNISSMTGYANAKVQTDMGLLSIDMRSVNSRFLDLSFRASEEFVSSNRNSERSSPAKSPAARWNAA